MKEQIELSLGFLHRISILNCSDESTIKLTTLQPRQIVITIKGRLFDNVLDVPDATSAMILCSLLITCR